MPASPIPTRHWRSYGGAPLPSGTEALDEPFRAFPSRFLRIKCDRCGKTTVLTEVHTKGRQREMPLRRQAGPGGRSCCGRGSVPHSPHATTDNEEGTPEVCYQFCLDRS